MEKDMRGKHWKTGTWNINENGKEYGNELGIRTNDNYGNGNGTRKEIQKQKRREVMRIGTWNVRGMNGKETELMYEFERANISVLGVTETKKKNKGSYKTRNGHVVIYSEVDENQRAAAGRQVVLKIVLKNTIAY